ncbi:hypothetical protein MHYP_G00364230 [Metynnis hypsauchen]
MSQSDYDDLTCFEELNRADQDEMVVVVYECADAVRGRDPNTETEDTNTKRILQTVMRRWTEESEWRWWLISMRVQTLLEAMRPTQRWRTPGLRRSYKHNIQEVDTTDCLQCVWGCCVFSC